METVARWTYMIIRVNKSDWSQDRNLTQGYFYHLKIFFFWSKISKTKLRDLLPSEKFSRPGTGQKGVIFFFDQTVVQRWVHEDHFDLAVSELDTIAVYVPDMIFRIFL